MKNAGADVFRSNQKENLGDFIIIINGKAYAVELGAGGKTAKQLRDLSTKIGEGIENVVGTVTEVIEVILGK